MKTFKEKFGKDVISHKNFLSSPIGVFLLIWLVGERLNFPTWVWGILGFLAVILLVDFIVHRIIDTQVDIFDVKSKPSDYVPVLKWFRVYRNGYSNEYDTIEGEELTFGDGGWAIEIKDEVVASIPSGWLVTVDEKPKEIITE